MAVDWGFAGQVGGAGFGMVFFLLIVLAIIVRLTGWFFNRAGRGEGIKDDNEKGA